MIAGCPGCGSLSDENHMLRAEAKKLEAECNAREIAYASLYNKCLVGGFLHENLKAENVALKKMLEQGPGYVDELVLLRGQNAKLHEALERYGSHEEDCGSLETRRGENSGEPFTVKAFPPKPCTCGLDSVGK